MGNTVVLEEHHRYPGIPLDPEEVVIETVELNSCCKTSLTLVFLWVLS